MSKHTPGPWRVGNVDPLSFGQPQGNGTLPLGFVYGPSHAELSEHGRECLANAKLCAAAPDLLEALTLLVRYFPTDTDMREVGCGDAHVNAARFAYDVARAAITKATGEQP